MEIILLCIKVLIYSITGYYIFKLFSGYKDVFWGVISPFYGFFGIFSIYSQGQRVPVVFLIGILGGVLLNFVFGTISKDLKVNINYKWFGIFNILNTFILNGFLDEFLRLSSNTSIILLFIVGACFYCVDLAISLRKIIDI